jgi:hypothetical protein
VASLPVITMFDKSRGHAVAIEMLEPTEPMRSLGMLTTVALHDGSAVDEAKAAADRVGVCVAKGTSPKQLWSRLLDQVAERSALYKIKTSSVGPDDIKTIQARCSRALKAKAGLCITTPDEVVSSLVSLDWTTKHFTEQLLMIMKFLSKQGTTVELLILASLQQHLLWNGGGWRSGIPRGTKSRLGRHSHREIASVDAYDEPRTAGPSLHSYGQRKRRPVGFAV